VSWVQLTAPQVLELLQGGRQRSHVPSGRRELLGDVLGADLYLVPLFGGDQYGKYGGVQGRVGLRRRSEDLELDALVGV
jgi:hypothetical protein